MDPHRPLALGLAVALLAGVLTFAPWSASRAAVVEEAFATGLDWPVSFGIVRQDGGSGIPAGAVVYNERLTGNVRYVVPGQVSAPIANVTVVRSGEQGLLGLALDPSFGAEPWVYLYHTYANATSGRDTNRVVRVWLGPAIPEPPQSIEVLLDGIPAAGNHNGGIVGFARDGTLFVTTGDAGVQSNAQDNGSLAGKVLRMNRDGSIPAGNPIPGSPVYTLGHRNVFGLAFHPTTGVAYVSENGPGDRDEVNRLVAGRNYGWPIVRGDADDPRFVDPVITYVSVIAPTGLAFYTGALAPDWRGGLLLGDWNRGVLQRLVLGGAALETVVSSADVHFVRSGGILDVEDGPDGYLYISTQDAIYRLREGGAPPGPNGSFVLPILVAVGALVALFAIALWRERKRGPPPATPLRPPGT